MAKRLYSSAEIRHIFMTGVAMGLHHLHKGNGVSKLHMVMDIILSEEIQTLIDKFITKQFNIETNNNNITSDVADEPLPLIIEEEDHQKEERNDTAKTNNEIDIYALD